MFKSLKIYQWFLRIDTASLVIIFLFGNSFAHAYTINYSILSSDLSDTVHFSTNPDSFSLSDSYDFYDGLTWEIVSAEDAGDGGVNVSYDIMRDPTVYGNVSIFDLTLEIRSDNGNLTPEPVTVDASGGLYLDFQLQHSPPMSYACCSSGINGGGVSLNTNIGGLGDLGAADEIEMLENHYSRKQSGTFDDTFTLLSNTTYTLTYFADLYIEGEGAGGDWGDPQTHFTSWDDYNAFVANYGDSGKSSVSANGFMNYNMVLSSVEQVSEPASIALMGLGLVGLGFARRKKAA